MPEVLKKRPKKKLPPEIAEKARRLNEQNGIPFALAVNVARGKDTLSNVLNRMLRDSKVQKLMDARGVPKNIAQVVVDGKADLDRLLLKQRARQYLSENWSRSVIDELHKSGTPAALLVDPDEVVTGGITGVDTYEFRLVPDEADERTVRKVDLHCVFAPNDAKAVREAASIDTGIRKLDLGPELSPQKRINFKHAEFQGRLESGKTAVFITRRGHRFSGRILWYSRWEVGIALDAGPEVTIFRHGLQNIA
ncbi:MAG: hypothetical protein HY897_22965 [Deltaproteobacteria bacterium]|nr:hypothetical protein [Deltaproteobacteria bacterium]